MATDGDPVQVERIPALNEGVYDRQCLCKSPLSPHFLTTTTGRRPAPHGHPAHRS